MRPSDPRKEKQWRKWRSEYEKRNEAGEKISVEQFAREKGVSTAATFWWWRRLRRIDGVGTNGREISVSTATIPSVTTHARVVDVYPTNDTMVLTLPGGAKLEITRNNLPFVGDVIREYTRGITGAS